MRLLIIFLTLSIQPVIGNAQSTICDFSARQLFDLLGTPDHAALGDFDGDSDLDLVVVDSDVSVFLNQGNGTFVSSTNFQSGGSDFVLTKDFDNDGDLDLAVFNSFGETVSIHLNNGDGIFQSSVDYVVAGLLGVAAAGDLDGDGDSDLVVDSGADTVAFLLNNGQGEFGQPSSIEFPAAGLISGLAIGDIDGDSLLDLVVSDRSNAQVIIATNDGNGSFNTQTTHATAVSPRFVCVADFNGDDRPDIATANFITSSQNVSVLINQGNGFAPAVNYGVPGNSTGILTTGDSDSDSDIDIAVSDQFRKTVSILTNNGSGVFSFTQEFESFELPVALAIADMTGDQRSDLIFVTPSVSGRSGVALFRNRDPVGITNDRLLDLGDNTSDGQVADLDQDGDADLVIAFDGMIRIAENSGSGEFTSVTDLDISAISLVLEDMDSDGDRDIVYISFNTASFREEISVLFNDGNANFVESPSKLTMNNASQLITGDVDNDGDQDVLVVINETMAGRFTTLFNSGDGTLIPSLVLIDCCGQQINDIELADFDNDHLLDVAIASSVDTANSTAGINILFNFGNGLFLNPINLGKGGFSGLAIGDINGDSIPDVVSPTGRIFVNNGDGTFQAPTTSVVSSGKDTILADLDGDGDLDLATNRIFGSGVSVAINQDGQFEFAGLWGAEQETEVLYTADINGDLRADLISFNKQNVSLFFNNCYILGDVNQNGQVDLLDVSSFVEILQNGEYQLEADMNLDGSVDLLDVPIFVAVLTRN